MSPDQEMDEANDPEILRERIAALEKERDAALADNAALRVHVRGWGTRLQMAIDCGDVAMPVASVVEIRKRTGELKSECEKPHPGAALLEDHRKALVRARNEGLEKAARETDAEADEWDGAAAHDGDPVSHEANAIRGAARRIRAMKEPES